MHLASRLDPLAGPRACFGCRRGRTPLCRSCRLAIPSAPPIDVAGARRAVAAWEYAGAARSLVLALKLRGLREAALPLVDAMTGLVRSLGTPGEVVAWVPGRRRDIGRRGYDHAHVLAAGLARAFGLPLERLLDRISEPPGQTSLSAELRRANVRGAFAATRGKVRRVILVDDVVTTGSTATECVTVLAAAGHEVEVVVPCATR